MDPPLARRARFEMLKMGWQLRVQLRRIGLLAHRYAGLVRRTLMAAVGLGLGMVADAFGAGHVPRSDLASYLVATGAMIGGTTAIVFSISLFLLQGVSDMYSSRHLEDYVNPWRGQLIFPSIIAITLAFFASGLHVASSTTTMSTSLASSIVAASLFLIGVVFALIDRQYEVVRRKVSPANMIDFLRTKAQGLLRRTEDDAAQIAAIVRAPIDGMTHEEALAVAYNRVLGSYVADLGRQTEQLVDVALRLAERHEVETARRALVAVGEIVAAYLQARRTSSLAFPSAVALLAIESDLQPFLSARFEQLNRAGLTFLRAGQNDLAAQVVDAYRAVADAAKDITPLGLERENPIIEWTMLSLNTYMRDSLSTRNIEVIFQGISVLIAIGVMASDAGLDAQLLAVQERLEEFGQVSLGFDTTVAFNSAISGLLRILAAAFGGRLVNREFAVERSLQGVSAMIATLTDLVAAGVLIKNEFSTSEALTSGYIQLHAVLDGVVGRYEKLTNEDEKRTYRRDLVMFFEELRRHFRDMTTHVAADSLVAERIGQLIFHVSEIILAFLAIPEFRDVETDLRKALQWLCYSPYWFLHETARFDANAGALRSLVEAVAKTGILAWQAGDKAIVEECIRALCDMGQMAVEKGDGSGYAQARMFERACYLGILASKSNWTDVAAELKGRLTKFEEAFTKRFLENMQGLPEDFDPHTHTIAGLPHTHQVANELLNWAGNFEHERLNGVRIMDDSEDMMCDLTDEAEIEAFVRDLWDIEQRA